MRIIGGIYKGRVFSAPKGLFVRPSSSRLRETVFNLCRCFVDESLFLDLFAGSGAMGFEAYSRGARCVTFVDTSSIVQRFLKKTSSELQVKPEILKRDVLSCLRFFAKKKRAFHIIFADPPYGMGLGQRVLESVDAMPLLCPGGLLFIEEAKEHPLDVDSLCHLEFQGDRLFGRTKLWCFASPSYTNRESRIDF